MKVARFPLGQIVATPGALGELERAGESPGTLLKRHVTGDWGDVDEDDRRENEHSLVQGCRLLSGLHPVQRHEALGDHRSRS